MTVSVEDDFRAIVGRLRGWGFSIREEPGCYGRGNGTSWAAGRPEGHVNHHYVCSLNPDQSYIDSLVSTLVGGCTVNWFADVNGHGYLIGTGPCNHAGTGNSSVLNLTRQDRPPPGPATAAGDMSGNQTYSGTECQHPGDATPWPPPMLQVMVAINAAEFLQFGYTAARAIDHYEWTNRKIDMSAGGGPASGPAAGDALRDAVADRMSGKDDDIVTDDDIKAIAKEVWAYAIDYAKQTNDAKDPEDNVREPAYKVLSAAASYAGRASKR